MEEHMNLKFGDFRRYISATDRVSICIQETSEYKNYRFVKDVPTQNDSYFVYGVGLIDSEFPIVDYMEGIDRDKTNFSDKFMLEKCIEVMLSEKPRY